MKFKPRKPKGTDIKWRTPKKYQSGYEVDDDIVKPRGSRVYKKCKATKGDHDFNILVEKNIYPWMNDGIYYRMKCKCGKETMIVESI